jgi:hypothetical protein
MKQWLSDLWNDPAKFTAFARACVFAVGSLPEVVSFGDAGTPAYWVGKALQVVALGMRAGDANKP